MSPLSSPSANQTCLLLYTNFTVTLTLKSNSPHPTLVNCLKIFFRLTMLPDLYLPPEDLSHSFQCHCLQKYKMESLSFPTDCNSQQRYTIFSVLLPTRLDNLHLSSMGQKIFQSCFVKISAKYISLKKMTFLDTPLFSLVL